MKLLTTDIIEDFEYLKQIYMEVLRYDTPIPTSSTSCFSRDVNIGGINFKKETAVVLAM